MWQAMKLVDLDFHVTTLTRPLRGGEGVVVFLVHDDSQRSHIDPVPRRYVFQDLKPASIPMDTNIKPSPAQPSSTTDEFAQMRDAPCHEAVGSPRRSDLVPILRSALRPSRAPPRPCALGSWEATVPYINSHVAEVPEVGGGEVRLRLKLKRSDYYYRLFQQKERPRGGEIK